MNGNHQNFGQIDSKEQLLETLESEHNRHLISLNGSLRTKTDTLYHYTNMESALSILESGKLRFTDINFVNDPRELLEGLEIFNFAHSDFCKSNNSKENEKFLSFMQMIVDLVNVTLTPSYMNQGYHKGSEERLARSSQDLSLYKNLKNAFFIFCLSESRDSLRQWIPYSRNGEGIALGFKGVDNSHDIVSNDGYWIVPVSYEDSIKKHEFVLNLYNSLKTVFFSLQDESLYGLLIGKLFELILIDIIACKSPDYRDEKEWRLICSDSIYAPKQDLGFKVRNEIIRPYVEADVNKDAITHLMFGPRTEKALNFDAIERILKFHEYKPKIEVSSIQYRG